MKIHYSITFNNKVYPAGTDVPWKVIYPFFLLHIGLFGGSGFYMAYGNNTPEVSFLYIHGGIAILVYTAFYIAIFGVDEVKWMFLNALFGLLGIYTQVGWLLTLFGRNIDSYPLEVHVVPFLYFVLYSFLVRRAILDITGSAEDAARRKKVENYYIAATLAINGICYGLQKIA